VKALRHMAAELAAQFRLRGSLGRRLLFVLLYDLFYGWARLAGLSVGDSVTRARRLLASLRLSGRVVPLYHPDAGWMELDLYSAAFLAKEVLLDKAYEERPGFAPRPGETVLDCGAHQGLFTLRAAARVAPNGRVISVEAYPPNAAILKSNTARSGGGRVTVVEAAALSKPGEIELYVTDEASGGQTTVPTAGRGAIRVRARTLDDILAEAGAPHPDLIKVDVEGAALEALAGAGRALEKRPRLVMEVEGGELERRLAQDWLVQRGYNVEMIGSILYAKAGA